MLTHSVKLRWTCRWPTKFQNERDLVDTELQTLMEPRAMLSVPIAVLLFFTPDCMGCQQLHKSVEQVIRTSPDVQFYQVSAPVTSASVARILVLRAPYAPALPFVELA